MEHTPDLHRIAPNARRPPAVNVVPLSKLIKDHRHWLFVNLERIVRATSRWNGCDSEGRCVRPLAGAHLEKYASTIKEPRTKYIISGIPIIECWKEYTNTYL